MNTNKHGHNSIAFNMGATTAADKHIKVLYDDDYLLQGALKALIEVAA